LSDAELLPQGEAGAVVVSQGVNKGKGSAFRTSPGYDARHGFDALVLLADMLKMYRRSWAVCYILYRMKMIESGEGRRE